MIDRDALARENFKAKLRAEWTLGTDWAEIALCHIEAAVAEERERLAVSVSALKVPEVDSLAEGYNVGLREAVHLIRAGSPAPTAPVVWTDEQADAALRRFMHFEPERPYSFKLHQEMRAALEAASREGKG